MHYILYVYQSVYIIYVCCVCVRMRGRECVCVMWACVWVCFHPVNTFKYACVFPYPFVSYVNTASTNTRLGTLIIFSNNLQQIHFFFHSYASLDRHAIRFRYKHEILSHPVSHLVISSSGKPIPEMSAPEYLELDIRVQPSICVSSKLVQGDLDFQMALNSLSFACTWHA